MKKFLPRSANNPSGFTLIELLVVISIIAILSVIGMAVFTNVQKNARDARRKGDINAIANALEAYKTSTGYVVLAATQFAGGIIPATDPQGNTYCANSTASNQPTSDITAEDCSPVADYGAVGTNPPAGTSWKICAYLENPAGAYCKVSTQ